MIIGIDPGLGKTGWAVISKDGNNLKYISSGVIKTEAASALPDRIHHIYQNLANIIQKFKPNEFAIEETFVNKNPLSSLKLGYGRAAAILAAANSGIEVFEYSAKHVKKAIVGAGAADKNQIKYMVSVLLPKIKISSEDEADAVAVAITHANRSKRI